LEQRYGYNDEMVDILEEWDKIGFARQHYGYSVCSYSFEIRKCMSKKCFHCTKFKHLKEQKTP